MNIVPDDVEDDYFDNERTAKRDDHDTDDKGDEDDSNDNDSESDVVDDE